MKIKMVIDFNEIPQANKDSIDSDAFEKFSREFFEANDFEIIYEPSRGADGGVDIIINESINYQYERRYVKWLVSCKHYSHSSKSIGIANEQDILDRVRSNGCDGFIGFYSTIPSSGLIKKLEGLKGLIGYKIFDNEKIERHIVGVPKMELVFARFFPMSYRKWKLMDGNYEPIKLLDFYLQNKYPNGTILSSIFGGTSYLIKSLKRYSSLTEALTNFGFTIIDIDIKWVEHMSFTEFFNFVETELPMRIEKKFGIKIPNCPMNHSGQFDDNHTYSFRLIYLNHIIKSNNYDTELDTIYEDLRDMIGYKNSNY